MCFRCYVISSLFFFLSLFFLSTVQLLQSFCACVCVVPVQADPCTFCAHMVQDLHMNEAFCSERSEFWLRLCFPQNRLRPRTPSSVMQSSSTGNLCVCVRESERNRALKWAPRVRGGFGEGRCGAPEGARGYRRTVGDARRVELRRRNFRRVCCERAFVDEDSISIRPHISFWFLPSFNCVPELVCKKENLT